MRIVFLGTPDFAVSSLSAITEKGYQIVGVYTQPDRQKGRGYKLTMPPVKELALKYHLPVYQCERIRNKENVETLRALKPDIMVTVAYGQILSQEILDIPPLGCVNVHASLLPKYRGSSPVHWAIINGEKKTGITTMYTSLGVDQGDIILQRSVPIREEETAGELYDRLSYLGAKVLINTLELIIEGTAPRIPQNEESATHCPMLKKEDGQVDFEKPVKDVHNRIRGVTPWPGAFGKINGKVVKIWKVSPEDTEKCFAKPGEIVFSDRENGMIVKCSDGCLKIEELQLPGGRKMTAKEFLVGNKLFGQFERVHA